MAGLPGAIITGSTIGTILGIMPAGAVIGMTDGIVPGIFGGALAGFFDITTRGGVAVKLGGKVGIGKPCAGPIL